MWWPALLALVGCTHEEPDRLSWGAAAFVGPDDIQTELALADSPHDTPLLLRQGETWELRWGWVWDEAEPVATYVMTVSGGLWINDTQMLPRRVEAGRQGAGVEVLEIDAMTVYYGTFDPAVRVDVAEGIWAGEQIFAAGYGPIRLTYEGQQRDMASYEWLRAE